MRQRRSLETDVGLTLIRFCISESTCACGITNCCVSSTLLQYTTSTLCDLAHVSRQRCLCSLLEVKVCNCRSSSRNNHSCHNSDTVLVCSAQPSSQALVRRRRGEPSGLRYQFAALFPGSCVDGGGEPGYEPCYEDSGCAYNSPLQYALTEPHSLTLTCRGSLVSAPHARAWKRC